MVEVNDRVYVIPLRRAKIKARNKRANAAISIIKAYLSRHMKADEVKLSNKVNEYIWERGMHKIPSKIKVKAVKKENIVEADLFGK